MGWKGLAALAAIWLLGTHGATALELNPPWAGNNSRDCNQIEDVDRRIRGCSRLLKHGDGLIPALEVAVSRNGRAYAHNNRGVAFAVKRDYDRAIADFSQAIALKGDFASAHNNRASAYIEKGEYVLALTDYDAAIRLNTTFAEAFGNRAALHVRMRNASAAKEDAEQAMRLAPDMYSSYCVRGRLLLEEGQIQAAIADLSEAIRLGASAPSIHAARGTAYEKAGLRELALADYGKAIEAAPADDDERKAQSYARQRLAAVDAAINGGQTASITGAAGAAVGLPPQPASLPAARPERRIALVIGNGAYMNAPQLGNPAADAHAVAESFRRLGFSEVTDMQDLGQAAMSSALKDFGDRSMNADWAVIFYAGHGIEVEGRNYLIPVDARLAAVRHVDDEAIPLERVLAKAEGAGKLRLVILDACRVNPFAARLAGKSRSIGRGLGRIEPAGGVLVAYAARDGAAADDGAASGHSPFTAALLKHIGEPGLDIGLLFRKVRDTVLAETGRAQEPFTYGSLPGEALYFKTPGG